MSSRSGSTSTSTASLSDFDSGTFAASDLGPGEVGTWRFATASDCGPIDVTWPAGRRCWARSDLAAWQLPAHADVEQEVPLALGSASGVVCDAVVEDADEAWLVLGVAGAAHPHEVPWTATP